MVSGKYEEQKVFAPIAATRKRVVSEKKFIPEIGQIISKRKAIIKIIKAKLYNNKQNYSSIKEIIILQ